MDKGIEIYLRELQDAMVNAGADPALVQDALFDAEEHLQAEMAARGRLVDVVQAYGSPEEVAAAYLGVAPVRDTAVAMSAAQGQESAPGEAFVAPEVAGGPVQAGAPGGPVQAGAHSASSGTQVREPAGTQPAPGSQTEVQFGEGTVFCRWCGTPGREGQAYCRQCGAPLYQPNPEGEAGGYRPIGYATPAARPPHTRPPYGAGPQPQYPSGAPGVQTDMAAAGAGGAYVAPESAWRQIFGVFADGRVWLSLVYMIVSLGLGTLYFTVVVTGLSTAGGMIVLIIGIPLLLLVLGLVRALSLFEGRVIEALLGTRMPRRLRALPPNTGLLQRIGFWLKDGRTWLSMLYMVLMLPLGIAYFTIAVTGLVVSLGLVTSPIWVWLGVWTDRQLVINGEVQDWWFPIWTVPIAFLVGCILLVAFMHLVKWIGRGHAAFAKAMLVRLQ